MFNIQKGRGERGRPEEKGEQKMKRMLAVIAMIVMTVSMTVTSFAGTDISEKEAVKIALRNAGLTRAEVYRLEAEREHGKYEVEFVSREKKTEFDYRISGKGTILEKAVEYRYKADHSREKIGKKAAMKKAAKHAGVRYNTVKNGTIRYEWDNGKKEGKYEIRFKSSKYRYEYDILAPTGTVMEFEKELRR